jgi:hypothetical protein
MCVCPPLIDGDSTETPRKGAYSWRGLLTGNEGCVVDGHEQVVRHHRSSLWITCLTEFRGWRWPLARPRRWTPLLFLDDAVALAARSPAVLAAARSVAYTMRASPLRLGRAGATCGPTRRR